MSLCILLLEDGYGQVVGLQNKIIQVWVSAVYHI